MLQVIKICGLSVDCLVFIASNFLITEFHGTTATEYDQALGRHAFNLDTSLVPVT